MPKEQRCPKCGTGLSAFATEGFCSACLLERGLSSAPSTGVPPLSRFGDYELIEEIARGGMGVVYKARQVSLDRIVAVKMILSGQFASAAEMQRFRAEARAAASIQHPNIVAIHEVGEHEGLLFFSMDYVEGHSLGELVREGPLPSLQAARCVEKIARAVHYAHQQGVLHRDLKPSNVLLDAHDEPHVTDFGLAKRLTDSELETRHPELTLNGQVLGTPSFMPPEQAAGQRDQMGPRSDVYSLGAILYHLLTARPPFVGADVHTILAQVINSEVVTPRLLNPATPRDLETIALKCLEKDPSRRYESALALAEELSRHLNHEPINAVPPSTIYRARKFVRRNRMAVAAAACFALVLTAASIVSTVFGLRARDESGRAVKALKESEEARNQAEAVSRFMVETLRRPDPAIDGREVKVVDLLDQSAKDLQENFSGTPKIKADILEALGQTYEGLDLSSNAVPLFETALNLRLAEFGRTNRGTLRLGNALANAQSNSKRTNVIALYEETLAGQRAALGPNDPDTLKTMAELGHTYHWLCRAPGTTAQWSNAALVRAEALMREAMERGRAHLAPDHPCLLYCVSGLGQFYSTANQPTNALPLLQEAVRLQQARLPRDHPELLGSKTLLAGVLFDVGQTNEALAMYEDAVTGCLRKLGPGHKRTLDAILGASWAYYRLRRWTDLVQLLDDFLQMRRLHNVPDSWALPLLERLAMAFDGLGKNAEALRVTQEALELGKAVRGSDDPDTLMMMRYLGTFQQRAGRSDDALRLREQTLELSKSRLGLGAPETHRAMWQLGISYFNAGRRDEAVRLFQDMLKLLLANPTSAQSDLMKGTETSINSVAAKLLATNRLAEAEQLLRDLVNLQN
ncbi:MAG: eukaryotic-like serine/threonine-protein kinase, partial [Verrucomicrobiota bacterium]